jgi:hypothetical protein
MPCPAFFMDALRDLRPETAVFFGIIDAST